MIVSLVLGESLELFLAFALLHGRDVDGRARVIADGPVPAATQLELDEIPLDLDERDDRSVAGTQRGPELLQPIAVCAIIDPLPGIDVHVDALLRSRQIDARDDVPALEIRFQRILILRG